MKNKPPPTWPFLRGWLQCPLCQGLYGAVHALGPAPLGRRAGLTWSVWHSRSQVLWASTHRLGFSWLGHTPRWLILIGWRLAPSARTDRRAKTSAASMGSGWLAPASFRFPFFLFSPRPPKLQRGIGLPLALRAGGLSARCAPSHAETLTFTEPGDHVQCSRVPHSSVPSAQWACYPQARRPMPGSVSCLVLCWQQPAALCADHLPAQESKEIPA